MKIEIEYNGRYPNLCSGDLVVHVDNVTYDFGKWSLTSGGNAWFDGEWKDHVTDGPWRIEDWPKNFPEELKRPVLDAINDEIPWGCCGGCL